MIANKKMAVPLVALVSALALGACDDAGKERAGEARMADKLVYPVTERGVQTDVYHGVEIADPYRWLESLDTAEVKNWVTVQNEVSKPLLSNAPGRKAIIDRLTTLWNYERYGVPRKIAGRYFYSRNDGLQDQDVIYVADSLQGESRVVIDPNTFSEDATIALSWYSISPDGKKIAYCVSDGGTDWKTWYVLDVDTGKRFSEELEGAKFTQASWTPDNKGFYYSRYPNDKNGKPDDQQQVDVYYHAVGTGQEADKKIYSITDHATRNPYASVTEDGRYLIIQVSDGFNSNAIYYQDLQKKDAPVVKLLNEWDAIYRVIGNSESRLYLYTNNEAPLGRIIEIDLNRPATDQWRTIVPESAAAISGSSYVGGQFFVEYIKDVTSKVERYDAKGEFVGEIALPGVGTASGFGGLESNDEVFYRFSAFTSPASVYSFDIASGKSQLFKAADVDIDPDAFETRQVFYESKDKTLIPMFIVHKKGIDLDGSNPTLLYGYGGFNVSLTPGYSTTRMVWLEMGGVLAIPNLRGGGEYGESWHLAGTKLQKQNVFDDFIAAAEWLIEQKYTSQPKLAIMGRSNGGLLVGASMTQRPDLFGAALPGVGVLDMLRYHTASANAEAWSSDYGLSRNEDEFKALRAYSPLHNVKPDTCYPPTLVTTADHDDRVVPWHSYKFAAELQQAQACDKPILIKIETRAGHGAGKPTWMIIEDYAEQWAFLVRSLGMDEPRF